MGKLGVMTKAFGLSIKAVVADRKNRVLLLRRSMKSQGNPGLWDLPGGKVEIGERFDDALIREVKEETGLEIEIEGVLGAAESESPKKRIAYLIVKARKRAGRLALSEEHDEARWVEVEKLGRVHLCPQFRGVERMLGLTRPKL